MYFELSNPARTSNMPIFVIRIYAPAMAFSPSLISSALSKANVENVVKEAITPMKTKDLKYGEILSSSVSPQRRPITNAPIRFTKRVPQGKLLSVYLYGIPINNFLKQNSAYGYAMSTT
jgi:hypothetical protein